MVPAPFTVVPAAGENIVGVFTEKVPLIVISPVLLLVPVFDVLRLLNVKAGMLWAPAPFMFTVLLVTSYPPLVKLAVVLKLPVIPIVPPLTSVTVFVVLVPLMVRLLKLNAGMLCEPLLLKSTVRPVII